MYVTFDFLVDAINSKEGNSRRIELLEEFLKAKEYTAREKAFLWTCSEDVGGVGTCKEMEPVSSGGS